MFKVAAFVVLTATACGGAGALAPSDPDAGVPSGAGGTGAAGSGAAGASGVSHTPLGISPAVAFGRIAAVLWNQLPDESLSLPTTAGSVATTEDLANVVRQMLDDPRAAAGVGAFYWWWLDLEDVESLQKDPALFPDFTPELKTDMAAETVAFGVDTTLTQAGSFQMLMTASWSLINARLASLYGLTGVTGDALQRVPLPALERAGLLTQPALQALGSVSTGTDPSLRGTYLLNKFFCQQVPVSPAGLPPFVVPPGTTQRTALQAAVQDANCGACHVIIDPPGLAFEGFDAIGRARSTDNGAPVDTANLMMRLPPSGVNGDATVVNGPVELAKLIASNQVAEDCMARQWLSFALGRELDRADEPTATRLREAFASSGYNLRELIVAVVTSDAFLAPR